MGSHANYVVNAHMQALLNLPKPANNHSSLQTFYDTIENHVRGLSSLGKSSETYGSLLTPIILNKLPNEIKKISPEKTIIQNGP